jgi:hypothetical protein
MKKGMTYKIVDGKMVWSVAGEERQEIKAPCEAMRNAMEKAERVIADIRSESKQTGERNETIGK